VHLDADEISFRMSAGEADQVLAISEADFEAALGVTPEDSIKVEKFSSR
jgi:hypothetical protein